jgi:hypothetical protein
MSVITRFLLALGAMWALVVLGGVAGLVTHLLRERSLNRPAPTENDRVPRGTSTARQAVAHPIDG